MRQLREVPRSAVRNGFQAARWPLQAIESVLHRDATADERATWPPTMLLDGVEAGVKRAVGSLLGDDELVAEGRLEEAKLRELRRSQQLDALADEQRAEADAELQRRRAADEAERRRVAEQAEAQERRLEQQRAEKKRKADAEAARKAAAARKVEAATEKALTRQEREARKVRVSVEQQAVTKEKQAVEAKADVIDLDRKIERSKAARKATSR